MVPVQITLIPLFIFYSDMGILNTSFSLILPQVGFALPLSVMMFVNFYDFVPNELIERPSSMLLALPDIPADCIPACEKYGHHHRVHVQHPDLE